MPEPGEPLWTRSLRASSQVFTKGDDGEEGKGHSEPVRDWSRKSEKWGAQDGAFPCPRGRPGSWPGKVRRRLGEGGTGRRGLPLGSTCLPAKTFSRLWEVRGELLRMGAAGLGLPLSPRPGARRDCPREGHSPSWRRPGAARAEGRKV